MTVFVTCFIITAQTSATNLPEIYEVPFTTEYGRIFIEVTLNGQTYDFMFDTGASGYGRVDSSIASKLNLPVIGQSNNSDGVNSSKIDNVKVESLSVAGITFNNIALFSRNYNKNQGDYRFIYGIIGRGFWEDYVLTIDYKRKQLVFSETTLKLSDSNTVNYGDNFEIPIEIGGIKTHANIDTGSTLSMHLPISYAEEANVSPLVKSGKGRRANTIFTFWKAKIKDDIVLVGNLEVNLEVIFSVQTNHINIGSALLQNYAISIDQKNHLIRLKSNY